MKVAVSVLLAVMFLALPAAGQERPDPARELTQRTYCALPLDGGHVVAGTSFGLVLYRLPPSRPADGGPLAVLVGPEPVVMLPDSVNDLWVTRQHVYVANGPAGIRIVPLNADRTRPMAEGIVELETPGAALSVAVEGDLLVAALGVMGVAAWDVSDPLQPALRLSQDTGGYARHVLVRSDPAKPAGTGGVTIFVANGRKGVAKLSLASDRSSVAETAQLESSGDVRRLLSFRDGLLFSLGHDGLCYVDLAFSRESVACVPSGDVVRGITLAGDRVVAADGGAGLMVVDWADPANPSAPAHMSVGEGSTNRVTVAGDSVIVAVDFQGIRLFSLRELPSSTSSHPPEAPR